MILQKCDICGKIEGLKIIDHKTGKKDTLKFTELPLRLTTKNVCGEDYDIFVIVSLQKSTDTKRIDNFAKGLLSNPDFGNMVKNMGESMEPEQIQTRIFSTVKLDNPNPSICDDCKKKMLEAISKA